MKCLISHRCELDQPVVGLLLALIRHDVTDLSDGQHHSFLVVLNTSHEDVSHALHELSAVL